MTPPSREEVFETITSQLREHNIVTFKWLSRTLKIHTTLSKEYLEEWIKKCPKDQFIISYTVYGRKDNGELLLMLTTEITDDHFSSKKITVIKKNVYSIHLSNTSFEPPVIYNVDKSTYELQQMSLSSINYHTEIIRKNVEATRTSAMLNGTNGGYAKHLQDKIYRVSPRKQNIDLMKRDDVCRTNPQNNGHTGSDGFCETSPKKDVCEIESQTVSNNQSTKDVNQIKQVSLKKSKTNKPVVPITNFFGRSSATKRLKNVSHGIRIENLNEMKENSDTHMEAGSIDNPVVDNTDEEISKKKSTIKTLEKDRKNRKSDQKSSTKKKCKQLKRIITPLDSGSDEDFNDSDTSINDILATDPESVEAKEPEPKSRIIAVGGKKRKRKVIEEEIEEDGFMVTIKNEIYESCDSEDESKEFSIEEKPAQPITIESSPPQKKAKTELQTKKKQSSILNFFQKPKESNT